MLPRIAKSAASKHHPRHITLHGCRRQSFSTTRSHNATAHIIPASVDDTALIHFFDKPHTHPVGFPTGLFTHKSLTHPAALQSLSDGVLRRVQVLTDKIVRAGQSKHGLSRVVKDLDRLSDTLCGVIDLAELIRNAHPETLWVQSANEAYEKLCEFMNVLNTHVGLYQTLEAVFSDETIMKSLSEEAYYSALIFQKDFQKSAIDLPSEQRNRFVTLSSEISVLGRQFLDEARASRPPVYIESSDLSDLKDRGMGARLRLQAKFTNKKLLVYPNSLQAQMIMRSAPAEEPRRRLYVAANTSPPEHVETLERLLRARAELARLVGSESYAHMALDDKMARSPENVQHFLDALISHIRPSARQALLTLSQRKQSHLGLPELPIIQAWDREYYCPPEPPVPPIPLPPLTPGVVFMGLSRLFRHLYGISFRPVDIAPGEVWHPDVRKVEVVDEEAGVIGWIYMDLFARSGKPNGAAHYTVRCSRRVDDDNVDADEDALARNLGSDSDSAMYVQSSLEFDSTHLRRIRGRDGLYQLPVVVLVCEFTPPSARRGAAPLEWHEVQTLFHEMGHAMHSMIGRTDYQSVAGTRCATDFVELPSILMEHFLSSPSILSLFDPNVITAAEPSRRLGNHHEDPCHYIDTYTQIIISWLDQLYHSRDAYNSSFDTTAILANLQDTKGIIPSVPGTSWQTQFGHLYGYGATYYSYLFDRVIASRVWTSTFSHDALNRETGERFKREILRYGGGKDPWKMVSTLLSIPELEGGDAKAMGMVGHWTIEEGQALPTRH